MKNTLTRIIIFVCLLAISACSQKKKTPICSIRIENDSIYVDGAIRDAKTLGIPLLFQVDPPVEYDNSDAELFRQNRLKNSRRACLRFIEKINGYDVQIIIHPDDNTASVGMSEWVFSKDGNKLRINTGFSWDWEEEIKGQIKDSIRYEEETYFLASYPEMVQGRDSVIHDTPFCFKDVDFDGEFELCFRCPGYNRYYFDIYKIISPTKAKSMPGHPYNNIVYSAFPENVSASTQFDYDEKTIYVSESMGCCGWRGQLYRRRDVVCDVLDPMEYISGQEQEYSAGYHEFKYYENGEWVRSEYSYALDFSPKYAACDMEAEYVAVEERTFTLQTLKLHDCDNEVWQTLYNK